MTESKYFSGTLGYQCREILLAGSAMHSEVAAAAADLAAVVAWANCMTASLDTRRIQMLLDPGVHVPSSRTHNVVRL